jgi:hypothetical protein
MNIADVVVGQLYRLVDIAKEGALGNLRNLTLNNHYEVKRKAGHGTTVLITNDAGLEVWIKAKRIEPQLVVPAPQINPFAINPNFVWRADPIRPGDPMIADHIRGGVRPGAPIMQGELAPEWEPAVGDIVRVRAGIVRGQWNGPGKDWPGIGLNMKDMAGQEFVINRIGHGQWAPAEDIGREDRKGIYLEDDPKKYIWVKEWLEPVAVAPAVEIVAAPGVRVRMREDAADIQPERNNPGWVKGLMDDMLGQEFTIELINKAGCYKLQGLAFTYHPDWFEIVGNVGVRAAPKKAPPAPKFKVLDVVRIDKKAGEAWIEDMDETIGSVTVVQKIDDSGHHCENGYTYAIDSLVAATAEEKALAIEAQVRAAQAGNIEYAKKNAGGVSSFTIFTKGDKGAVKLNHTMAGICHAAMGYGGDGGDIVGMSDYLFAYVTQVPKALHPAYKNYVDYIINRSPWHVAYKKASADRALKEGLNLKVGVNGKILGAACVALRLGKEFAQTKLPIYDMCVEAGYEEAVAWIAANCFHKTGETIQLVRPTGAHTVIDVDTKVGPLINLMRYGYTDEELKDKPYSKTGSYRGFTAKVSEREDFVKEAMTISTFLAMYAKPEKVGAGFDQKSVYTQATLFAFCDKLASLFHKQDVME